MYLRLLAKRQVPKWFSGTKSYRYCYRELSSTSAEVLGSNAGKSTRMIMLSVCASATILASMEPSVTLNHCQVPCGIFDDPAMVAELNEACTTIRKAIRQSNTLHGIAAANPLAFNQMVRWINTKEEHCDKIISIIGSYCLCQRVKRDNFETEGAYLETLKVHHNVMQLAMKAKQTMDEDTCNNLEAAVEVLSKIYKK